MNFRQKGFTLIELLVVIGIISVLASIVMASVQKARDKALEAKGSQTLHNFTIALNLYYDDHGTWPARASDGRMVISNKAGTGWTQFYAMIQPYMKGATPDVSYLEIAGFIKQGLLYVKGTEAEPVTYPMFNSGVYIGCIKVYEGYWMDELLPSWQTKLTLNDAGMDPDGLDIAGGHYLLDTSVPQGSCPISSVTY